MDYKELSILIIDDEKGITDLLDAVLTRDGYSNITTCNSGLEALELLGIEKGRDDRPPRGALLVDLVMLDIVLPNINGFDVCRRIKNELSPMIPVVLMTGYNIEDVSARGIEAGADFFFRKPLDMQQVRLKLGQMLSQRLEFKLVSNRAQAKTEPVEAAPRRHPEVGDRINEYEILESIYWGGSSIIYKVMHNGAPAVIKMLALHALNRPEVRPRFDREVNIIKQLKHPNIIEYYCRGEFEECPYWVMEYIDGRNLEQIMVDRRWLDFNELFEVAYGVANALAYLHEHGFVHRDIKLNNILYTSDGKIKLHDFDIASQIGDVRLTEKGYTIGTPLYMAPEQFEGGEISPTMDIYSYGATLYHLMTGRPPFAGASAVELMRQHLVEPAPSAIDERPEIPFAWDDFVVGKCLAKRSNERFQSMAEVMDALVTLKDTSF